MHDISIRAFDTRGGLAASLSAPPPPSTGDILPVTLAFSVVFHAVLLLITFAPPNFTAKNFVPQLEVVLVNSKSSSKPLKVDALAQASLEGGGNTETKARASTNLPKVSNLEPSLEVQLAAKKVQRLEEEAQRLLRLAQGDNSSATETQPAPTAAQQERLEDPALEQQRLLIAQLEARIEKEMKEYQELPRRKAIGSRTEGVVYAEYVDKWRRRIEQVGTSNYPEEAKRSKIYGSLLMTVHIKADGSVEKVEIDRSSGHRLLDAAARRVVELAGPFPPFPAVVRRDWDILSISRTWMFTRSDLELIASP
ncbi:MAG TPA: TonB family protein [Burkholderiales bacterium]|nr:TonB family protein [Burkholderiales bacterium]